MKKRVLYYKGHGNEDAERLKTILEATVSKRRLDIHETVESLSRTLRQMGNGVVITVLFVGGREDLENILAISDLLHDIYTILILPDGDPEILTNVHKLRPRFLSYVHSNFVDVATVLDKMYANINATSCRP